jgi:hypothetical protein
MRSSKVSRVLAIGAASALAAGLGLSSGAAVADPPDGTPPGQAKKDDVRHVGPNYNNGKKKAFNEQATAKAVEQAKQQKAPKFANVGDTKLWLALDDINGIYAKDYTLRGVGKNIQVWVADDRAFPDGDCRNDLGLTEITDQQVKDFIHEFDRNIYPLESEAFSVPPNRNGSQASADEILGLPSDYWQVRKQRADDIVVLVDNVRDANYYEPLTPDGQTYIAGFHYSIFNEYHDRNIMTIDAYDWLHRTGENPPDDSQDPAYLACEQASGAPNPLLYEGVFAHEYQHLLEYYEDTDEASWVNEGLADWAQTLVGYVDPSVPVSDPAADSHLACFAGYLEQSFGGPENSLTRWEDQGGPETLCDYGATYSMMQYLFDHYGGQALMTALHREDANGLDGLENALATVGYGDVDVMQVLRDWAAMAALDEVLDGGATLTGGDAATYSSDTLGMSINWDNPEAYTEAYEGEGSGVVAEGYTEGAPTNGSDYVRLRDAAGTYLDAGQIESISFDGADEYAPFPVEWTVDETPPDSLPSPDSDDDCGAAADGTGDAALYSGCGHDLDRTIAQTVTVPTDDPTLTFDTLFDTEAAFDYGFVDVSTDGGETWTALPGDHTQPTSEDDALPNIPAGVPALQGDSGGWISTSYDLSDYAGQDVLLGFRYVTDPAFDDDGWWIDDVAVGGTVISDGSSLDGWQSYTQVNPSDVENWTVQLVAYDDAGTAAWVGQFPLGEGFSGTLSGAELDALIGTSAETVAAIVMAEDRSETVQQYASYELTVDGVLQPGGGTLN